jgi:hypothetical protein
LALKIVLDKTELLPRRFLRARADTARKAETRLGYYRQYKLLERAEVDRLIVARVFVFGDTSRVA